MVVLTLIVYSFELTLAILKAFKDTFISKLYN
ncbi:MAG: hypothetical protein CSYNP_01942 [Syntrophus sp. SKADARSKE-3]|nr:hypothetical protein [Syntrophus sp. SKADARSKE-3]